MRLQELKTPISKCEDAGKKRRERGAPQETRALLAGGDLSPLTLVGHQLWPPVCPNTDAALHHVVAVCQSGYNGACVRVVCNQHSHPTASPELDMWELHLRYVRCACFASHTLSWTSAAGTGTGPGQCRLLTWSRSARLSDFKFGS